MKKLTIEQVTNAVKGELLLGDPKDEISGVSTDSRKVVEGEIFFPLIGEQHDAHGIHPPGAGNGMQDARRFQDAGRQNGRPAQCYPCKRYYKGAAGSGGLLPVPFFP